MSAEIKLTLKQLLQASLGTETMNNVSIKLLYNFICLILKKLNCENEKVSIGGFESKNLQKLSQIVEISPFMMQDENLSMVCEHFNKIIQLEQRAKSIDAQFEQHYEDSRACNAIKNKEYEFNHFAPYALPTENTVHFIEPDFAIVSTLIRNTDFITKLRRRLTKPLVMRMQEFESQIFELEDKLSRYATRNANVAALTQIVEPIVHDVEKLRHKIDDNHNAFLNAMEELDEMLEAKFERVHIPVLKKYVKDRLRGLRHQTSLLNEDEACPKESVYNMHGNECFSCGVKRAEGVSVKKGVATMFEVCDKSAIKSKPSNVKERETHTSPSCMCIDSEEEPTLKERMTRVSIGSIDYRMSKRFNPARKSAKFQQNDYPSQSVKGLSSISSHKA